MKLYSKINKTEKKDFENFYLVDEKTGMKVQIKPSFLRDYKVLRALAELNK